MSELQANQKDFHESWGYPNQILQSIPGCAFYKTRKMNEKSRKGDDIFITYFLDKEMRTILSKRYTLRLISKKTGEEYFMCALSEYIQKFSAEDEARMEEALERLLI